MNMLVSAEIVVTDWYTQYSKMILICAECRINSKAAAKVYSERFPKHQHPMYETTTDTLHRLREIGSVAPRFRTSRRAKCNLRLTTEELLAFALLNAQLSMAEISGAYLCTRQHIWHLLHAHSAHPYHQKTVQAFILSENVHRFYYYCNFMLSTLQEKPWLLCDILWTDESTFTRDCIVNVHDVPYYSI